MTIEEFVTMIWKQLKEGEGTQPSPQQLLSLSDYGHRRGWLEDKDVKDWNCGIERRTAARIIHEILRKELNEEDEESWRGAERLKDIYDCHTCVNHVAQVYAKGIMESVDGSGLFGMREELPYGEAEVIALRIFHKEQRKIPKETGFQRQIAVRLSRKDALKYFSEEKQALLIDVRTLREYEEEHLPGAVCIPLAEIIRNPHSIIKYRGEALYFYCQKGYQSEIAANCVAEAGYERVFYFASTYV